MDVQPSGVTPGSVQRPDQDMTAVARETALRLEASFLSEMLKSAGFDGPVASFGESGKEDHFASFHRKAIADQMVRTGGIGLAEHFFTAMMEAQNGNADTR